MNSFSDIIIGFEVVLTILTFILGVGMGAALTHPDLHKPLWTILSSIGRFVHKHYLSRLVIGAESTALADPLSQVPESDTDKHQRLVADPWAIDAARRFCDLLGVVHRSETLAVYLIGSRARGNYQRTSDADIAVIFPAQYKIGPMVYLRLIFTGFKVMFSHGLYLQVHAFRTESDWASCLQPAIAREGILIYGTAMLSTQYPMVGQSEQT